MTEYIEKTQKELGAIITAPKLTEKLLSKPPFRFLHDVVTAFLKTTGFPDQLYGPDMLDSSKVGDKESKIEFLRRLIAVVEAATKQSCPAKPAKIVAGHEPENTNKLLQMLAQCASLSQEQKAQAVREVTAKSAAPAAPPPVAKPVAEKEAAAPTAKKEGAAPEKKSTSEGEKKKSAAEAEKKSAPETEKKGGSAETKRQAKPVEAEPAKRKARPHGEAAEAGAKEVVADKSSAPAATAAATPAKRTETEEERHARHEEERRRRHEERKKQERMAAEARRDTPAAVAEDDSTAATATEEAYVPAAESRRRREAEGGTAHGSSHRGGAASRAESGATTTTTTASAGKAPPRTRPTHEVLAAQAGLAAAPAAVNVIAEAKPASDDEDEDGAAGQADWQKVAENFGRKLAGPAASETRVGAETEVKGALAQQALQAKKAQDAQSQEQQQQQQSSLRQPESGGIIIRSSKAAQAQAAGGTHAMAEGDLSKLREQLQLLTKASNPLGKFLEAIHDDLDSMTRELAMWRSEARSQLLAAADARRQTHESLQEIQANVLDLENAITDQESKINYMRRNIIANDRALGGMVHMIVHPEVSR